MKKIYVFLSVVIITQTVFADMMCDTDVFDYYAIYEPNSYTCASGQFLPANAVACVACPAGFNCNGGTFEFNPDYFQGATLETIPTIPTTQMNKVCAVNFPRKLHAKYVPNSHTCSSGYYLPANIDECTLCPSGSACVGGTYTFNAHEAQGIIACDAGYFSVAGSAFCTGNTITVTWDGADEADITANNAGTVTYGGDIRTPKKAQHINGKVFVGWKFDDPQ